MGKKHTTNDEYKIRFLKCLAIEGELTKNELMRKSQCSKHTVASRAIGFLENVGAIEREIVKQPGMETHKHIITPLGIEMLRNTTDVDESILQQSNSRYDRGNTAQAMEENPVGPDYRSVAHAIMGIYNALATSISKGLIVASSGGSRSLSNIASETSEIIKKQNYLQRRGDLTTSAYLLMDIIAKNKWDSALKAHHEYNAATHILYDFLLEVYGEDVKYKLGYTIKY